MLYDADFWSAGQEREEHGVTARGKFFEELGDLVGQAHALNNLRTSSGGSMPASRPMRSRCFPGPLKWTRRLGDATNAANADYNRADVLVRQGRSEDALPLLENTLRVARAVGDEELVALVLKELGRAREPSWRRSGRPDTAGRSRAHLAKLREPHEVVDADIASAEAHLLAGSA